MSTGLIALLDDVVGLAKVAAASLDDTAAQAARAGAKAAGVVVDDAAVTPRYVVGFSPARELPIIGKIALGSLRNKLVLLLPAALVLSLVAPWAITPLLMLGGAFLCYEGAEKVHEALRPHAGHHGQGDGTKGQGAAQSASQFEDAKVRSAIQTDLILSAEIMAITLSTVAAETSSFWAQAVILGVVGTGITVGVYGAVAIIVKADDVGLSLAQNGRPVTSLLGLRTPGAGTPGGADRALRPVTQAVGRGLVHGMPVFLRLLALVGTAAMLWVGGGILIHGLEGFGLPVIGHAIHAVAVKAAQAAQAVPAAQSAVEWLVSAAGSGVVGLAVGAVLIPLVHKLAVPLLARLKS